MRGFLALTATLVLAGAALAQGWSLKAPYDAKTKFTWKVNVNANMGGQDHDASMKQVLSIDSKTDKEIRGKANWTDLVVDGNEMPTENDGWDFTLAPNGSITSAGESEDWARMMAPLAFIYPDKEVKVGDKWTVKYKPAKAAKEITVDYEVAEQAKVGDAEALRIKGKISEDGPLKGDGVYWIGKDGKLLKYELNLKGWIVPMAGSQEFDATIKAELVKN